jgi:hypothetical protein
MPVILQVQYLKGTFLLLFLFLQKKKSLFFFREEVILHKTFHRYVVRAKRGTVQSVHDNAGGHAKSAGANIRRQQEAAFKDVLKN